jgi:hypothetical protein
LELIKEAVNSLRLKGLQYHSTYNHNFLYNNETSFIFLLLIMIEIKSD